MRRPTPSLRTVTRATSRKSTCERCASSPSAKRLAPSAAAPTRSIPDFDFLSPHPTLYKRSSPSLSSSALLRPFTTRCTCLPLTFRLRLPLATSCPAALFITTFPCYSPRFPHSALSVFRYAPPCLCRCKFGGRASVCILTGCYLAPSSEPDDTPTIASYQTSAYTLPSTMDKLLAQLQPSTTALPQAQEHNLFGNVEGDRGVRFGVPAVPDVRPPLPLPCLTLPTHLPARFLSPWCVPTS